ncbi:MAG TPA: response regulator transcription factor [Roseiarcus sp.]|jgi:DNA-binding NarL/FixJ family response regulator
MIASVKRPQIVLVVDDSPDTLRVLTDALDAADMTVLVALDGAAAIRIAEQVAPDIVLLDAVMPGIDGFETCRRLKRDAKLADTPIIFMTGLAETEDIVRGLQAGGVDYVTKPVVIEEMLARIRVHLANARLTKSARAALDVSGRYLFVVNPGGAILWATPRAQTLLAEHFSAIGAEELAAPAAWREWLGQCQIAADPTRIPPPAASLGDGQLRLQFIVKLGPDEILLRLAQDRDSDSRAQFSRELGLTSRESEVLSWLSVGKANRDIAQILGLSPRTVDKHLEQIYAKLGVENRTAATAIAVKASQN